MVPGHTDDPHGEDGARVHTHTGVVDSGDGNGVVGTCADRVDTWDREVAFPAPGVACRVREEEACSGAVVPPRTQGVVGDTEHPLHPGVEEAVDRAGSSHPVVELLGAVDSQVEERVPVVEPVEPLRLQVHLLVQGTVEVDLVVHSDHQEEDHQVGVLPAVVHHLGVDVAVGIPGVVVEHEDCGVDGEGVLVAVHDEDIQGVVLHGEVDIHEEGVAYEEEVHEDHDDEVGHEDEEEGGGGGAAGDLPV